MRPQPHQAAREDTMDRGTLAFVLGLGIVLAVAGAGRAHADETCMSPYMPKITGQEDYVYVWTLGIEGVGDGSDKVVTIGANPADAARYGKVIDLSPFRARLLRHANGRLTSTRGEAPSPLSDRRCRSPR